MIMTLFNFLNHAEERERKAQKKNGAQPFTKKDILVMQIMGQEEKYEVEKSKHYIGYKLLWFMKLNLEGRQFPYGSLSPEQWKKSVIKIAGYINQDYFINKLIEFDSNCFLDVISRLFYGEAFWFIDKVRTRT